MLTQRQVQKKNAKVQQMRKSAYVKKRTRGGKKQTNKNTNKRQVQKE